MAEEAMQDDYLALFWKEIQHKRFRWPLDELPPEILKKMVPPRKVKLLILVSQKVYTAVQNAKPPAVVTARQLTKFTNGKGLCEALTQKLKFCNLDTLILKECELKERGAATLAYVLGLHQMGLVQNNVRLLDLNDNELGDGGVRALRDVLWHNSHLTSLDLGHNRIGPEGWKDVGVLLRLNTTLLTLSLIYNPEGKESGNAIAFAMEHNHTLTSLNLSFNNYDDVYGESLASALRYNTALTNLDLYCNKIRDRTGSSLARMLRTNTTLTSLNIRLSNITNNSGIEIAMALRQNTTLRRLDISRSDMGAAGEQAFVDLEANHSTCEMAYLVEPELINLV